MEDYRELFADLPALEGVEVTDKKLGRGSDGIVLEVRIDNFQFLYVVVL